MFSVIMPVYNSKQYLGAAIESVLGQTISDLELIIVDDGSTDGSYERSLEIAAKDNRVRVFQNSHGGVSSARNRGIEESLGDILVFIDSDDFWEIDLLENAEETTDGICKIFGLKINKCNNMGETVDVVGELAFAETRKISFDEIVVDKLFAYNIASPCNKFYERSIILKNNIRFNTQCVYLEDLIFNLEYLRHCNAIEVLNKNLYNYRVNIDSKQILKRNFKEPFENADALFYASKDFLSVFRKDFSDTEHLQGTVISAYCKEAFSWMNGKNSKNANAYLRQLNNNKNFRQLLSNSSGKFLKVLQLTIKCNLLSVEKGMLKKRYW